MNGLLQRALVALLFGGGLLISYGNATANGAQADLAEPLAEVVWAGRENGTNHLYYSFFKNGSWSPATAPIYSSDKQLTTPALATLQGGKKILFWTEQQGDRAVLMKMSGARSASDVAPRWQQAGLFSDLGRYNIAPIAVVDEADRVWLFWSADVDEYSDIYFAKQSKLGWSKPLRVNRRNKVPDTTASARFNEAGELIVSWQTYDLNNRQYQLASRAFMLENPSPRKKSLAAALTHETKIVAAVDTPTFLLEGQRILIHFPNNTALQSLEIEELATLTQKNYNN